MVALVLVKNKQLSETKANVPQAANNWRRKPSDIAVSFQLWSACPTMMWELPLPIASPSPLRLIANDRTA
jgi:hypothetical protein